MSMTFWTGPLPRIGRMRSLSFSSRTRAMSAANTDFAPPAGAVMMVTVPALTASTFGNVHRLVSGLKTGCWLGACCGGGAAGVVCAVASCNDRLTAAAASVILIRYSIQLSLTRPEFNGPARRLVAAVVPALRLHRISPHAHTKGEPLGCRRSH